MHVFLVSALILDNWITSTMASFELDFLCILRFSRAVSYRQLVRLVWDYTGSSTRYPLPCCAYARVRKEFPRKEYVVRSKVTHTTPNNLTRFI